MPFITPIAQNHVQVVFSPEEYARYSPMWARPARARTWPFRILGRTVRASFADHDRPPFARPEARSYTSEEAGALLALLLYAARFHDDHTCDASAIAKMCAAVGVQSKLDTSGSAVDLTHEDPDMWRFQDQYRHPYGWSLAEGCPYEAISEHVPADQRTPYADLPSNDNGDPDDTDWTLLSDGTYIHSVEWDYVRAPFTAYMSELADSVRYVAQAEENERERAHSWALTYIMHACQENANGAHADVALSDTTAYQRAALAAMAAESDQAMGPDVTRYEGCANVEMRDYHDLPFGFCFRWRIFASHGA